MPLKFKVFTNKEIGCGSTRICYEALGESGGCTRKMVAKQLITVDNRSTLPLTPYLETKQTYIAVAKYLKTFQEAAETINGCQSERNAISDLKLGTHQYIVATWTDY